jgi:geranylgeranyl diphosphate synthase type I
MKIFDTIWIENKNREFAEIIQTLLINRVGPLYKMMEYQLGTLDQNGEPITSLISNKFLGSTCTMFAGMLSNEDPSMQKLAKRFGATIEILNLSKQVHDDIQDGAPERNGKETVWWIWGPAQAINVGDGLHALSRITLTDSTSMELSKLIVESNSNIQADYDLILNSINCFDLACLRLFEGQYDEIHLQEQLTVTEKKYLDIIEKRAGSLFACAAELGAILTGKNENDRINTKLAGSKLGLAYELSLQVKLLWGNSKNVIPDSSILSKKKLLPVVYAIQHAPITIKQKLASLYMKRVLNPTDFNELLSVLDEFDVQEYCQNKIQESLDDGISAIQMLSISDNHKEELMKYFSMVLSETSNS